MGSLNDSRLSLKNFELPQRKFPPEPLSIVSRPLNENPSQMIVIL
jgi:hypothetical protein